MGDLLYKEECYLIQGCIFEVYRKLGSGFLEAVYKEALKLGLLVNFHAFPKTEIIRIAN